MYIKDNDKRNRICGKIAISMQIPLYFNARWYQSKAIRALENGANFAVWCWSRRGGKDLTAFCYGIKKAVEAPMNVVIIWPTKVQGFKNFWTAVDNDGVAILDRIPEGLIAKKSSTKDDMSITLINGSTITLLGATDPDALRGANGKLYILSEFVDLPPGLLGVLRPVVAVNGGQIIIQSTPKIDGVSGATFQRLFNSAKKKKGQYASLITAKEYLSDEQLESVRQEYIEEYGNDFLFRQEFLCDWGQTSQTSYYGEALKKMREEGREVGHVYNDQEKVYTAWDLGRTAIVFFQYYLVNNKPQLHIIDYYETHVIGNEPIAKFVLSKPYNYGWHFFPHDGAVKDQSDGITRLEKFRDFGLVNSSLLRREPVEEGIKRVVSMLKLTIMDTLLEKTLKAKLVLYKRKFNGTTGNYEGPDQKTQAHGADAFRYVGVAIEQEFNQETCELYHSQVGQSELYESEEIQTNMYSPSY